MPRILIVGDDAELRDLIAWALRRSSHVVEQAGDGIDAFEQICKAPPDVVLLDLTHRGMEDGRTFLQDLRADPELASVAVIVSSSDCAVTSAFVREFSIQVCLVKPFNARRLRGAVEQALARSRRQHTGALPTRLMPAP